ncbi:MAG: hypothetical protein CSA96_05235 [Bacteroidetes bacterium]|nr:MAG: hypothetical protein CSA96_05235 [Bacteroidota bacterium]
MSPGISVHIPVYNQPQRLQQCLGSVQKQLLRPAEVLIIDDASTVDYSRVLHLFPELNIKYVRNSTNLGPLQNMLRALHYPTGSDYVNVFHEDDLMHKDFLKQSLAALESAKESLFSWCEIGFHKQASSPVYQHRGGKWREVDQRTLTALLLEGKSLGFGTVVYRKSRLAGQAFDLNHFSVLADRPFLLSMLDRSKAIVLEDVLVSVNAHEEEDTRWSNLKEEHVYHLHTCYKSMFPGRFARLSKKLRAGFSRSMLDVYRLLPAENKVPLAVFVLKAWFRGLISLKYTLLTIPRFRNMAKKIQGIR